MEETTQSVIETSQVSDKETPVIEAPVILDRNAKLALAREKALEVRKANAEARKRAVSVVKKEGELQKLRLKQREDEVEEELKKARTAIEKTNMEHLLEEKPKAQEITEKPVFKKPTRRKPQPKKPKYYSDEEGVDEDEPEPRYVPQPQYIQEQPIQFEQPRPKLYGSSNPIPVYHAYNDQVRNAYNAQIAKHKQSLLFRNMLGF